MVLTPRGPGGEKGCTCEERRGLVKAHKDLTQSGKILGVQQAINLTGGLGTEQEISDHLCYL